MVALTETVRAVGKHAQRSEIAAEYQPDELQHEEQRHGDDLYLLDELLPKPVLGVDRSYGGSELSIGHPAGRDIDALFAVLDGDNPCEPLRRLALSLPVLSGQCLAVPVDPLESVDLGPLDLLFQQLADRLVVTDQRLIGHQRREEGERFSLLAQQPGRMLGRPFGHEERGLHAPRGDDRRAHGKHQPRNQSPILPEPEDADVFHVAHPMSSAADYLTCVALKNLR